MTYTQDTQDMMKRLTLDGFKIYAMLQIYKKRSKLSPEVPDEVVQAVCQEYFKRGNKGFPYFLTVLKQKTEEYFANQNVMEGIKIKQEPLAMKDIMKRLLSA